MGILRKIVNAITLKCTCDAIKVRFCSSCCDKFVVCDCHSPRDEGLYSQPVNKPQK
jgi:hypothetical protein